MVTSAERAAARARAASERQQRLRRRQRRKAFAIAAGAAGVAVVAGAVTVLVLSAAPSSAAPSGRTIAPPWNAPTDVEARVHAAGLTMLTAEGTALHIHQHLTVTVDGRAVTVPADLGIDEAAQRLAAIHTHDTSGVIHVESPEVRTFHLGQVFTEWHVRLGPGTVGPYENGRGGVKLAVFVNQRRYSDDPRTIPLTPHEDVDIVITHGATPEAPPKFTWPSGL